MARAATPKTAKQPSTPVATQPQVDPESTESRPRKSGAVGRPKSPTEAVAKAIYFRDRSTVDELEKLLAAHPRSSLSGVIQQLLGAFTAAYKAAPPADNKLTLTDVSVYL